MCVDGHFRLPVDHFSPLDLAYCRFELSPFLVIPIAFVFVSYLQHVHDKANSALALGVVKDPKVRKLLMVQWCSGLSPCAVGARQQNEREPNTRDDDQQAPCHGWCRVLHCGR